MRQSSQTQSGLEPEGPFHLKPKGLPFLGSEWALTIPDLQLPESRMKNKKPRDETNYYSDTDKCQTNLSLIFGAEHSLG